MNGQRLVLAPSLLVTRLDIFSFFCSTLERDRRRRSLDDKYSVMYLLWY